MLLFIFKNHYHHGLSEISLKKLTQIYLTASLLTINYLNLIINYLSLTMKHLNL